MLKIQVGSVTSSGKAIGVHQVGSGSSKRSVPAEITIGSIQAPKITAFKGYKEPQNMDLKIGSMTATEEITAVEIVPKPPSAAHKQQKPGIASAGAAPADAAQVAHEHPPGYVEAAAACVSVGVFNDSSEQHESGGKQYKPSASEIKDPVKVEPPPQQQQPKAPAAKSLSGSSQAPASEIKDGLEQHQQQPVVFASGGPNSEVAAYVDQQEPSSRI